VVFLKSDNQETERKMHLIKEKRDIESTAIKMSLYMLRKINFLSAKNISL